MLRQYKHTNLIPKITTLQIPSQPLLLEKKKSLDPPQSLSPLANFVSPETSAAFPIVHPIPPPPPPLSLSLSLSLPHDDDDDDDSVDDGSGKRVKVNRASTG